VGRGPTIEWRILIRLLPLLALVLAIVLFWLGAVLEDTLYDTNLEVARRLNAIVASAIGGSMRSDKRSSEWMRAAEEISRMDGAEIEVVSISGKVLLSRDGARRGRTLGVKDRPCSACHKTNGGAPSPDVTIDDGERYQLFSAPLRNTTECRSCHEGAGAILGKVLIRQPLGPVTRQVRIMQAGVAAAGVVALVVAILLTRLLIGVHLSRPLRKLVDGARAIGAGDLHRKIEIGSSTELAVLAAALNDSTDRLARMQEKIVERERLAAVGETVAGLSHCLKNTLNGLRAGQYVIERAAEKNDTKRLYEGWRVMKGAVRQVERLTFDMLYFIKERVPEKKPGNPNRVVREVRDLMHQAASNQGVEIALDLDPRIGEELLDRDTIYRAILNLVTNAIEACTESETGDLVTIRTRTEPAEIVISVADNGIGMSEELRSKLFRQFFSTKAARGTGLGLPVVRKIAEEHGGRLDLESEPGKGSAFHMHLPRAGRVS